MGQIWQYHSTKSSLYQKTYGIQWHFEDTKKNLNKTKCLLWPSQSDVEIDFSKHTTSSWLLIKTQCINNFYVPVSETFPLPAALWLKRRIQTQLVYNLIIYLIK